ncbi:MAG: binding-protein-dependent transport system inner rane component, partial [Modestobacter sp.]|nr:binding-protein-dependent transport system inner rane component [Modestobacter sp.]
MTAVLEAPPAARPRLQRVRARWAWGLGAVAVVVWSLAGAGLFTGEVVNPA